MRRLLLAIKDIDYLSFRVARPTRTNITEIIQNRTITRGSAIPLIQNDGELEPFGIDVCQ